MTQQTITIHFGAGDTSFKMGEGKFIPFDHQPTVRRYKFGDDRTIASMMKAHLIKGKQDGQGNSEGSQGK